MSVFSNQLAAGLAAIRGAAGEPATYRRGLLACPVTITRGTTNYESIDSQGNAVIAVAADFMLAAAELSLGGGLTEPQPGDRIEPAAGGTFEAMELSSEDCFRYSDPGTRSQLRVHTKKVSG